MDGLRREFVEQIRGGVALTPELAAAFATVPREAFVREGFRGRKGRWLRPGDDGFSTAVYRDDVLVTKVAGKVVVSSSSQPSLMALMIGALDVHPGQRILEIGAGTGYNAALLAALGASVTSVEVQPDVADRARSALTAAGIEDVRVVPGDGYAGLPGGRFDRVIVTVGIAGLSPRWLEQLTPDGVIVAPVDHAGMHPVLAARPARLPAAQSSEAQSSGAQSLGAESLGAESLGAESLGAESSGVRPPAISRPATGAAADAPLIARLVCHAGFLTAAGPLTADYPDAFPRPATAHELGELTEFAPPRFAEPLDPVVYRDLWYAAGAWHRRASHAAVPGVRQSCLALLDRSRRGGAVVLPDGRVLVAGPEAARYGADAVAILDRWAATGHRSMRDWRVGFALTGDPAAPIWVPARWSI